MKKHHKTAARTMIALFLLSAFVLFPPAAVSAEDCQKNADACAPGAKNELPFLDAAAAAETKAKTETVPAVKVNAVKEFKPAAAVPEKAAVPDVSTGAPARQGDNKFSSPAWLLFVGAAMAGLYFYLRGNARSGRKR